MLGDEDTRKKKRGDAGIGKVRVRSLPPIPIALDRRVWPDGRVGIGRTSWERAASTASAREL